MKNDKQQRHRRLFHDKFEQIERCVAAAATRPNTYLPKIASLRYDLASDCWFDDQDGVTAEEQLLAAMPPQERRDALDYYSEYFDAAGPDHEAETAEKLGIPQITYAEELVDVDAKSVTIKRRLERGVETVKAPLPCLVTVHGSAKECRPRHAVRVMQYKHAATPSELAGATESRKARVQANPKLQIQEWSAADLNADPERLGLAGSPTKVKKIDNVVLVHKEAKVMDASDQAIDGLMKELISTHIVG